MFRKLLPAVTAVTLICAGVSVLGVSADDQTVRSVPSFELSLKEENPADTLKNEVIRDYLSHHSDIDASTIDASNSMIVVNGLNAGKACIQPVTISVKLARKNQAENTVGYDFTEKALINVINRTDPTLVLRGDTVTVNNGDNWNPSSYICYIADAKGNLPVIRESDNVDSKTDGNYIASYTAIDSLGRKTTKNLNVVVKTPDEVIAQQQAEAAAAEEAARQQAEQAAAQQEAVRQAQIQQAQQQQAAAAGISQGSTVIDGNGTATGANIVAIARSWVGNGIYAYGGNDPATGADCSGFTQYVYRMAGININRVAAAQAANGVRTDNPQPGDLVLWTGHAGIYAGNGNVIQAMNPYQGIQETSVASTRAHGGFMGYYHINGVN